CASVSQPIAAPTALHSFPTRRSSDLAPVPHRRACPDPRARRGSTHLRGGAPRGGGNGPAAGAGRGPDPGDRPAAEHPPGAAPEVRSEEHTSELQSRENLVCRLLLEKKKKRSIESIK